jgi:hypothetical protein
VAALETNQPTILVHKNIYFRNHEEMFVNVITAHPSRQTARKVSVILHIKPTFI